MNAAMRCSGACLERCNVTEGVRIRLAVRRTCAIDDAMIGIRHLQWQEEIIS